MLPLDATINMDGALHGRRYAAAKAYDIDLGVADSTLMAGMEDRNTNREPDSLEDKE